MAHTRRSTMSRDLGQMSDERESADILATDYNHAPNTSIFERRSRPLTIVAGEEEDSAAPIPLSSSDESDSSWDVARRIAGQQPTTLVLDTSRFVLPDVTQSQGPVDTSRSSGMARIGENSAAPSSHPAWTAAIYNTIIRGSGDHADFSNLQQSKIEARDLLAALSYAAECHAYEQGEYNLALHKAKEIGLRPDTHFQLAYFGPWGRLHVGDVEEWESLGETQQRQFLVGVVREIRLLKAARIRVWEVIGGTEERWMRLGKEQEAENERVRRDDTGRIVKREKAERCCRVM